MVKINNRLIRVLLFAGLILGLAYFFHMIQSILTPFILAIVLAYLLHPLVKYLESKGVKRVWAITLVYISLIGLVMAIIFNFLPKILVELNKFGEEIPVYTQEIQEYIRMFQEKYSRVMMPESIRNVSNDTLNQIENYLISIIKGFTQSIILLFSKLFDFILAPILAFYILKDIDVFKENFLMLLPYSSRDDILLLGEKIDNVLKNFLRGNLIIAFIVGALTTLGLIIIKMDFALVIGFITGILNVIPYFGAIIAIFVAVALALLNSTKMAIYVFVIMLIIQQIESSIISPKILGENLGLHPLVVVLALLAGGHLFGIVGMILFVPLASILKIFFNFIINKVIEL